MPKQKAFINDGRISGRLNQLQVFVELSLPFVKKGSGNEVVFECPKCGGEKFYVNTNEILGHCKLCEFAGNYFQILQVLAEYWKEFTSNAHLSLLAQDRSLPLGAFINRNIFYCPPNYYLPIYNTRNSLVSLRRYQLGKKFMFLPGCPAQLYGAEQFGGPLKKNDNVYIAEGEWDALALRWCFESAKMPGLIVAVPGAQTFKQEWVLWFRDRNIFLCYDNDEPGQAGSQKTAKLLKSVAKSIKAFSWKKDDKKKKDIRDLIVEHLTKTSGRESDESK